MGKCCLHASSFIFDRIIVKVAGNQDRHNTVKFDFGLNQTYHFGVTCPWVTKISYFWTWIPLKPVNLSWSNFMCSIIGVGERLHKVFSSPERRLTRWAYSIPMVRRPSVVVQTFKLEYLWRQLANLDQILCVASVGWGKDCIRFWGRLDQNSGFHGNRKPPLAYNGENDVSTFSRLFFIRTFLYLQVTRTCIKSRTSSNFGKIGPLTTELAALERLKKFP